MNQNLFSLGTLIFFIIGVVFSIKNKGSSIATKNILMYSVIPSIIFVAVGHLLLGSNVRDSMGWGDTPGVVTLQRELGLFTVALLMVSILKTDVNIGLVWGLFLLLAGINHVIVTKKIESVAISDIVYGVFLVWTFR